VVKLHDYKGKATFEHSEKNNFECAYLVFDYIVGGELFDMVISPKDLPESGIRLIFGQIL